MGEILAAIFMQYFVGSCMVDRPTYCQNLTLEFMNLPTNGNSNLKNFFILGAGFFTNSCPSIVLVHFVLAGRWFLGWVHMGEMLTAIASCNVFWVDVWLTNQLDARTSHRNLLIDLTKGNFLTWTQEREFQNWKVNMMKTGGSLICFRKFLGWAWVVEGRKYKTWESWSCLKRAVFLVGSLFKDQSLGRCVRVYEALIWTGKWMNVSNWGKC